MLDLVVIGGGNMGAALLGGLVDSGVLPAERLGVVELLDARRDVLRDLFPGITITDDVPPCASAVLAVKPGDIAAAAASAVGAGARRLLSIAAGVRIATIESAAGASVAVIRAMPNTPALVRLGACAIAAGSTATEADVDWAASILEAVGTVERLSEDDLDAFTGVAGSGPAYVFLVAEALTDAAIEQGLDPEVAQRMIRQLLLGSATLLDREGDPARLREMVTSPGGTTAAGLARLTARGVPDAFSDAVHAATERSRELG